MISILQTHPPKKQKSVTINLYVFSNIWIKSAFKIKWLSVAGSYMR